MVLRRYICAIYRDLKSIVVLKSLNESEFVMDIDMSLKHIAQTQTVSNVIYNNCHQHWAPLRPRNCLFSIKNSMIAKYWLLVALTAVFLKVWK